MPCSTTASEVCPAIGEPPDDGQPQLGQPSIGSPRSVSSHSFVHLRGSREFEPKYYRSSYSFVSLCGLYGEHELLLRISNRNVE